MHASRDRPLPVSSAAEGSRVPHSEQPVCPPERVRGIVRPPDPEDLAFNVHGQGSSSPGLDYFGEEEREGRGAERRGRYPRSGGGIGVVELVLQG